MGTFLVCWQTGTVLILRVSAWGSALMGPLPQWRSRFEKAFGFFGVRSSFAMRLNIFKIGALGGNTAAHGRSLLADLHSVANP